MVQAWEPQSTMLFVHEQRNVNGLSMKSSWSHVQDQFSWNASRMPEPAQMRYMIISNNLLNKEGTKKLLSQLMQDSQEEVSQLDTPMQTPQTLSTLLLQSLGHYFRPRLITSVHLLHKPLPVPACPSLMSWQACLGYLVQGVLFQHPCSPRHPIWLGFLNPQ